MRKLVMADFRGIHWTRATTNQGTSHSGKAPGGEEMLVVKERQIGYDDEGNPRYYLYCKGEIVNMGVHLPVGLSLAQRLFNRLERLNRRFEKADRKAAQSARVRTSC